MKRRFFGSNLSQEGSGRLWGRRLPVRVVGAGRGHKDQEHQAVHTQLLQHLERLKFVAHGTAPETNGHVR